MRKTLKIACMLLFAAFAMPEMAQAQANKTEVVVAGLISELQTSGYSNISERRTWLGRLRIRAERGEYIREIIINPRTGEILRDYHFELEDGLFGFFIVIFGIFNVADVVCFSLLSSSVKVMKESTM